MSRAGKYPIEIKQGVNVELTPAAVVVKGPKGELRVRLDTKNAGLVDVKIEDGKILVIPKDEEDKDSRAMWGTMARNIKAAIIGVTDGWAKEIWMNGVGYKASVSGKKLIMNAGYSHDVVFDIPDDLTVEIGAKPTEFTIRGADKNAVGQFADKVRKVRRADPYKGKGIFYKGEKIHRKEGKKK